MEKVYNLMSDNRKSGFFSELKEADQKWIQSLAMRQGWRPFSDYKTVSLELIRSDEGYKNYKLDFSSFLKPFFIFSQQSAHILKEILEPRGQFLDVITASKRKKFIGYYPTNVYPKGILDLDKSKYDEYPTGLIIHHAVLIKEKIPDEYLFTIEEDFSRVFVSEKFKKIIEDNNLVGFEFSEYNEIELSNLIAL